ncbi:unnamed protein product [Pleuronectes platessa]|uniref:Uncharacterized protein n=1 Tax=Pleuronectes platessa TaxID=8262 RepID=A0A9N7VBY6_PLEPL|nr:unnamed protein product [Pleuronectes platessa]
MCSGGWGGGAPLLPVCSIPEPDSPPSSSGVSPAEAVLVVKRQKTQSVQCEAPAGDGTHPLFTSYSSSPPPSHRAAASLLQLPPYVKSTVSSNNTTLCRRRQTLAQYCSRWKEGEKEEDNPWDLGKYGRVGRSHLSPRPGGVSLHLGKRGTWFSAT